MNYKNIIILFVPFLSSLEARERKILDDVLNPTQIVIFEYGEPEVKYTLFDKSKELQRQALLAFKLQQFEDSESCYSLAFKASPKSKDIVVEYIFCSLLVPITSKSYSLSRAKKLMAHLENLEGQEMERYWIAKALISIAGQDQVSALDYLVNVKSSKYKDAVALIKKSIANEVSFHWSLLERLLPVRQAPREKRSNRR